MPTMDNIYIQMNVGIPWWTENVGSVNLKMSCANEKVYKNPGNFC